MPCAAPSRNNLRVQGPCGYKVLQRAGLSAPSATEGAQGWWKLEETSGASAADGMGANPGVYLGGPTLAQPGAQGGNAVLLDGATQGIEIPASFPSAGDVFTLMCWARPSPFKYSALFSRGGAYLVRIGPTNTTFSLTIYGLGAVLSSTPVPLADGQWHHFAVAKNGATTTKLYFDGADVSGAFTDRTSGAGSGTVRIGCSHNGALANEAFPGWIDEPMIFNTYLSAARIAEFARGKDTSADSLCQFHYQMKYGQLAVRQPTVVEP